MGQMRQFKTKVQVGAHHDPNESWAREPRLSGVAHLRSERRSRRRQHVIEVAVLAFGLGWMAHTLILG